MQIKEQEPLSAYSTFGIGGPARWFITVTTIEMMQEALSFASTKQIPFHVLGKGSNTLFDDRGFAGLVIHNKITDYRQEDERFIVGSGFSFSLLGLRSAKAGYRGLEFAAAIPATVGGAIYMNAGANGQETEGCLSSVDHVDSQGTFRRYLRSELTFSYRSSSFQAIKGAIVGATFTLIRDETTKERQLTLLSHRQKSQPLKEMSCGCIFKNPEGSFAGKLIEEAGLKGLSCGGAEVSFLHANFIVNRGQATAQDVALLIEKVKSGVHEKCGVLLESEVRRLSYDGN